MYYIYEIFNDVTQRRYIGQTKNLMVRHKTHMTMLKHGRHTAENMQADAVKYGVDHFFFLILDTAETSNGALKKERRYMEIFKTYHPDYGYNGYDSRFCPKRPHFKVAENSLTNKIKEQGYLLRDIKSLLHMDYNALVVKLNNPSLFTKNQSEKLNDYIEISKKERVEKWLKEFRRKEGK